MIPALLSVIIAFGIMGTAIVQVTMTNLQLTGNIVKSQQAFNVAEAGLNYYMWHLNHNPTDYKDGKTTPATPDPQLGYGPYTHTYIDSAGVNQGTYTLWIKPSSNGATIATVRSIGKAANTDITRTVQAQIGTPSFASYAVVSDNELWFGSNETANGPVHSNVGVHMDGANTSTVSAANATYTPSTQYGGNGSTSREGVWCTPTITTPVNCNTRSKSAWIKPVPLVDFNQVTSSLCTMKKAALADYSNTSTYANQSCATVNNIPRTNAYIPRASGTYNAAQGYLIKLNANGTYDLLRVTAENNNSTTGCCSGGSPGLTTTNVSGPSATNLAIPPSGVIFVDDNVWVYSPTNFKGRVSVAAGRLDTTDTTKYANISIAGQLLYSTKNGSDAIGLVAQGGATLKPYAPPATGAFNFEVNAAVLAQTGDVKYPSGSRAWTNTNQTFLFYGSVATREVWTWTWCGGTNCATTTSGIERNTTQYDYNLLYNPPPKYPLTSGFNILSWRQVITKP